MGKVAEMSKTKKKKGRPSLLDLQKRSLRLQQKEQQEHGLITNPNFKIPNPPNPYSNPTRRSTRRNPNPSAISPAPDWIDDGDDDDERKEKKVKLVVKLPSHLDHHHHPRSSANSLSLNSVSYGFDSDAGGENHEASKKKRKINAVDDRSGHGNADKGEKVSKATDTPHGSRSESGPTTPLPDKKLLVFILDRLQKKDTYGVFSEPVDPKELPDYHDIIEHPMDFGTVRKNLDGGLYSDLERFEADVFLICANAMQYNAPDTIYFRQARSIQELAKRDFENLRRDSDSDSQPKVVRRGRPPSKNLKKSIGGSPSERVAPDLSSGATLATGEDTALCASSYNLRKGPTSYKFRAADAPVRASCRSRNIETYPGWSEGKNEFSVPVLKGVSMKHGKKQFTLVDENRRDTYKQCLPSASAYESSALTAFNGELKQLMVVGLHSEHGYARSLARFAANLGPVVWKIASKKIQSVLPPGLKFGPGWVGENEAPQQQLPSLYEKQISSINSVRDGLPSGRSLPPSTCSNSVLANRSSLHGKENMVETRGLNSQSEFCSLDGSISGIRSAASFQIQQKPVIRPDMNGFSGGFGFNSLPQIGMVKPGTSTAMCSSEDASLPSKMLGMASGSNNTSIGPTHAKHLDSQEPKLCGSLSRVYSGNWVPELGPSGKPSWQGLSLHHNQDSLSVPPDLNVRFQSPGSPSSTVRIGSPQQPDLALQL